MTKKNVLVEEIANIIKGEADSIHGQPWLTSLQEIAENMPALVASIIALATSAETIAGIDAAKAVTPAGLAALTATATRKGLVELATNLETIAVTDQARAVTPYGLGAALPHLNIITFTGAAAPGPCAAVGVAVGDVIYTINGLTDVGVAKVKFQGAVTVVDQIQQVAAENLSAKTFIAFLYRPS